MARAAWGCWKRVRLAGDRSRGATHERLTPCWCASWLAALPAEGGCAPTSVLMDVRRLPSSAVGRVLRGASADGHASCCLRWRPGQQRLHARLRLHEAPGLLRGVPRAALSPVPRAALSPAARQRRTMLLVHTCAPAVLLLCSGAASAPAPAWPRAGRVRRPPAHLWKVIQVMSSLSTMPLVMSSSPKRNTSMPRSSCCWKSMPDLTSSSMLSCA